MDKEKETETGLKSCSFRGSLHYTTGCFNLYTWIKELKERRGDGQRKRKRDRDRDRDRIEDLQL